MKKIVPFNNILEFNTDVFEITAISLEHEIEDINDMISGKFYITGEYKITEGQLERESFSFELPFGVALGSNYDLNTLEVDIDDFRYELIDNKKLKVNIDLYIDGDIIEESPEEIIKEKDPEDSQPEVREEPSIDKSPKEVKETEEEPDADEEPREKDLNILSDFLTETKYVTYRVYRVIEGDTIDKIIEKYNTSQEELEKYNDIDDIKIGDKLIIPANDK